MHTEEPVHALERLTKKKKKMQNGSASMLLLALVLCSYFADVEPVLMLTLHSNLSR
jgi:hypothetical protein